jgi:hypothetical protein
VDERGQTGPAGENKHNGSDLSENGWAAIGTGHLWSRDGAASGPSHDPDATPVREPALLSTAEAPERRWASGLDDSTPPGGTPGLEPPLWREAARYAGTATVPPWEAPVSPREPDRPPSPPVGPERHHLRSLPPPRSELPQRVPAEPDVPDSGELWRAPSPSVAPHLARIADQLRRDDVPPEEGPTEGFDVDEVLDAVRGVAGVRAASLRTNPNGAHTLRLDLADDADPVQVSGVVARLLQEQMGLSAAPRDLPAAGQPNRHAAEPEEDLPDPLAGSRPPAPPLPAPQSGTRVVIDQVQVNVEGMDATVEVRLAAGHRRALGLASGPAIDSYVVRLAAVSAAKAIDELMRDTAQPAAPDPVPSRCFVEHTGVVPFGSTEVAVVVVLLVCGGWVEQLAGSAVVDGDARHAAVRATLGAVNRRLDALLA